MTPAAFRKMALGAIAAVAAAAVTAGPAGAATISPTVFTDERDFTNANCSLREAIEIANEDTAVGNETDCPVTGGIGDDTIALQGGTPYVLSITGNSEDNGQTGDLDVNNSPGGDLTIDGVAANATTIDAAGAFDDRILHQTTIGALLISDLTIMRGNRAQAANVSGAGIASTGALSIERARLTGNFATITGGAISGGSLLTITDSTIDANTASGSFPSGAGLHLNGPTAATITSSVISGNTVTGSNFVNGGGISQQNGSLTLERSLVDDNHAIGDAAASVQAAGVGLAGTTADIRRTTVSNNDVSGGATRRSAALQTVGNGSLDLVNSTVSGNQATGSGTNFGAMQLDSGSGDPQVINSTIAANPVPNGTNASGLFYAGANAPQLRGSILTGFGSVPPCGGAPEGAGFNIASDSSCFFPASTGDEVADPMLGPLQDNGGPDAGAPGMRVPVPTHDLDPASTAVDHVPANAPTSCIDETLVTALTLDQRGLPRPQDGDDPDLVADCDAGPLERQPPAPPTAQPPVATPPATTPSAPPSRKKCKKGQKLKRGKCVKKKRKK